MSPYHHPNEQADYQAALEKTEEKIERETLELNSLFLEVIEQVFENEEDFVRIISMLHRLAKEDRENFLDAAEDLRLWLHGKIYQFARRKAEQEVANSYWRNR
jgi:hypothetical protein